MSVTTSDKPTAAEISRHVVHVFGQGAVHRDMIIAAARGSGARREVMERLELLPAYRYGDLDQLLRVLPPILY
jgi:hypothetical protein